MNIPLKIPGSILSVVLSCNLLLGTPAFAGAGDNSKSTSFSITAVTDNISLLQGKGGNIALLQAKEGILLIDSDYADMTPALKHTLAKFGGEQLVVYLLNTHWHGDHTGGNPALGEQALIVAHQNVRERLSKPIQLKAFNIDAPAYPDIALPEITYQKAMTLYFGDEAIRLEYSPGSHTDGDTVVFFTKSNVVHTGDLFFNGMFPFVDLEHGGNVLALIDNVKKLLPMLKDNTVIIPGHGPLAKKKDLQAYLDMLLATVASVIKMKSEGMSLPQIQAKGLSQEWDAWGNGIIPEAIWLGLIYNSL